MEEEMLETTETESQEEYRPSFEELYYAEDNPGNTDHVDDEPEAAEEPESAQNEATEESTEQPWKTQENANFAARRREEEVQRRINEAVAAARDALVKEAFEGQTNPFTQKPFENAADYDAYRAEFQKQQFKDAGLTEAQLDQLIQQNPVVQRANQIMQERAAQEAEEQRQRGQQQLNDEIKMISQIDPSVKTIEDVLALENFAAIQGRVDRGYSLIDAYRLENMDKIVAKQKAAAKQETLNRINGKQHMKQTGNAGAGIDVHVPADVMEMYHVMNPRMTDAQIRKHYASTLND